MHKFFVTIAPKSERMDEMNKMDPDYVRSVKAEQWQIKTHELTDFPHESPTM